MFSLVDSLVRQGSVRFFLELPYSVTIAGAAKKANISRQHASKLVRTWRTNGFIEKDLHSHYRLTERGTIIAGALRVVMNGK